MQLSVWTYEGPPHVGVMRVAASMRDVHLVLHAPQGDTYADLLFTMIERRASRPPVTYTTFQARDLGGDTANLFMTSVRDAYERFRPSAVLVSASCTAELIQDDPGGLGEACGLPVPVIPVELSAYSKKENWGASETLYRIVRSTLGDRAARNATPALPRPASVAARCNILGPTSLGFRHRDDVREVRELLEALGVSVNVVAPLGASMADIERLPDAGFNVVLYPEVATSTAQWLERSFGQPYTRVVPIGVGATRDFVREVARLLGRTDGESLAEEVASRARLPWYSRSVDSTYLTGKRVFVFGDGAHAIAAARVATTELGFTLVGLGTYSREMAREVRAAAAEYGLTALISDDYLDVESAIAAAAPELVLGTQMERHVAKRLGVPCAVISAPIHVQDFPARHAPQMGVEGANVLFDTWVHPLMMGLEEHLLTMFRDDFEFHDGAAPSHLGHAAGAAAGAAAPARHRRTTARDTGRDLPVATAVAPPPVTVARWSTDAERELAKIPFFVRPKARRNTESFAREQGLVEISVETLYDAKAHFGR